MSEEMFAEAVRAYKDGQRRRARDLLTRLLKTDANNLEYWLWLSAAVETEKEQVFCLQKALKLDPNSQAARHGLAILGALKPEEAALPPAAPVAAFTPAMPARQALRAAGGFLGNARNRELLLIVGVCVVALGLVGTLLIVIFRPAIFFPRAVVVVTSTAPPTATALPSATVSATPTLEPCVVPRAPDPAQPLSAYLCLTQTPAPPPVPTTASLQEDYQSLVKAYLAGQQGDAGAWTRVLNRAALLHNDQVLSKDPTVYFFEAEAYRATNDFKKAIASYNQALGLNPSLAPAYIGRALAQFNANNSSAALKDLEAALNADPNAVAALLLRAQYYEAAGNLDRAAADLALAGPLAPANAEALARLALVEAANGQYPEARDQADQALARDPGQVIAYYARGLAELALGQAEAADKDLSLAYRYIVDGTTFPSLFPVAAAMNVDNVFAAQALYAVGAARFQLSQADARQFLDDALKRRPNDLPLAYLTRGQLQLQAGDSAAALTDLSTAISQFRRLTPPPPDMVTALLLRGQMYLEQTEQTPAAAEKARLDFQEASNLAPQRWEPGLGLGRAQLALKQPDAAINSFTLALGLAAPPADPAPLYYWRAQAFQAAGRPADQVADLQALAALTTAAGWAPTARAQLTAIGPLPSATVPATATLAAAAASPTAAAAPSRTAAPGKTPTPTATVRPSSSPGAVTATPTKKP